MRITNQMLARTAAKSGIPLQQNTLLDIMNKKSSSAGSLFPSISNTSNANSFLKALNTKSSKELKSAAESLSSYVSKLNEEGENSLFGKAEATGDTSEVVTNITNMANAYNKTYQYLSGSDSALNKFYAQELKNYVSENSAALRAIGITANKDGSLNVSQSVLKAADIESLKKAFGSSSGFSEKVGYVSGRAAENASVSSASILGGYNSSGLDIWNSFSKNMYDFWG